MGDFYYSRLEIIYKCRDNIEAMLKNKEAEWKKTAKENAESDNFSEALMLKDWAYAASILSIHIACEFSKVIQETITEMNAANCLADDEVDSKEWNCHQQMNG